MTEPFDDTPRHPMNGGHPPSGGHSPLGGHTLLEDERTQRNIVIGLSVGAAVVLVAGIIAFALTRNGGGDSPTATLPVESTVPDAGLATSTTTGSTSTTSTSIASTTTVVIAANADAGQDLAVDRDTEFVLTAMDVAAGTPDTAVRWTQTSGPDVTGGAGTLSGIAARAIAPTQVSTLTFRLEVAGTDGVATDDVVVRVFEDADRSVFVDGERGDDGAGDGSVAAPFKSLPRAVDAASGRDVYVRSVGTYDTSGATLVLGTGTSLYGGFDAEWNRDVEQRAVIDGADVAIVIDGPRERWLSAIELTSADGAADRQSVAVVVVNGDVVHIEDSRVLAGAGGAAVAQISGGASVGVLAQQVEELRIERTTVNSGRGADGAPGAAGPAAEEAATGSDATGRDAGAGGTGNGQSRGGDGGDGGLAGNGAPAPGGGAGGTALQPAGTPGTAGVGGAGGRGGDGGIGLRNSDDVVPLGADGAAGSNGAPGSGGRGGGGGFGLPIAAGGGGGGGGAGGSGGAGAAGAGGGAGSVGIWAVDVERIAIVESLVAGGRGGIGGVAVAGSMGASGGRGGAGAVGEADGVDTAGDGGGGSGGGAGGSGGQGGSGAGGPSYGLLTTRVGTAEVSSSTVRAGAGGNGGPGGRGGSAGGSGVNSSSRNGASGGAVDGPAASQGAGASGGSSFGWFDASGARQVLDDVEFVRGTAGRGGSGSVAGSDGIAVDTDA